jgi:transcriptional regulator
VYLPRHFAETRAEVLHALVRTEPLGTLVTEQDGEPVADEIPFLLRPELGAYGTLQAHVARANPLWCTHTPGKPVLLLFRGPQAYVSPSWYPDKAEHGKVVPTWNYIVVQALGTLQIHDDPVWVHQQIRALTDQQEGRRAEPWAVDDAPADYLDAMRRGIVGIEVQVLRWTGKWKMSQNHSAERQAGVQNGLLREPQAEAAALSQAMADRASRSTP